MVSDRQWLSLLEKFDKVNKRLLHDGSVGIMEYVSTTLPLIERLRVGDRSEELFAQIAIVVNEQGLNESTRA